jgi:hypothetical protein
MQWLDFKPIGKCPAAIMGGRAFAVMVINQLFFRHEKTITH